jgi:hypothetical protein
MTEELERRIAELRTQVVAELHGIATEAASHAQRTDLHEPENSDSARVAMHVRELAAARDELARATERVRRAFAGADDS